MTEQNEGKKHIFFPYCDEEVMKAAFSYCQVCQITMFYCHKCRKLFSRENRVCPHCGADIRGEVSEGR